MPIAEVRGVHLNYEVVGGEGPWVVILPGGRNGMERVRPVAELLAAKGYRVLLHDRRNCGKSDVGISGGESESGEWADDLDDLTRQLDAQPCVVAGSSSGSRTALTFTIRHPGAVSGLILWRISAGPYAALNLGVRYYAEYIKAAGIGGMKAVCETDFFASRIEENERNREILMSMEPMEFVRVMVRWMGSFIGSADAPIIGASADDLRAIDVPALMFPGCDRHHPREVAFNAEQLIPNSRLIDLGMPVEDVDSVGLKAWNEHLPRMVDDFDRFIREEITKSDGGV